MVDWFSRKLCSSGGEEGITLVAGGVDRSLSGERGAVRRRLNVGWRMGGERGWGSVRSTLN